MELDELTLYIGNKLLEMSASDVELLQVEQKSKLAKRMVMCTASDCFHAKDLANKLKESVDNITRCFHMDGIIKGDWIVMDFDDVVVHIFTKGTRQKFNIEKLYKDAKNFVELK